MSNNSNERITPTGGYIAPIAGLLALLFALMAGGSAYPAITSGSLALAIVPVIFGGISLLCLRIRQRALEAKSA